MALAWSGDVWTAQTNALGTASFFAPGQQINSGEAMFVVIGFDNIDTTDLESTQITAVHTATQAAPTTVIQNLTKIAEYTNGQGSAGAGISVSLWVLNEASQNYTVATHAIRVTAASSLVKTAITASTFTKSAGSTLTVQQYATNASDGSSGLITALNGTSLPNREYIFMYALAQESNSTTVGSMTTGYTAMAAAQTSGGSAATNALARGYWKIITAQGSNIGSISPPASVDSVSILAAVYEVAGAQNKTLGVATNVNAAQTLRIRPWLGRATATSTAQPLSVVKPINKSIGVATNLNTAITQTYFKSNAKTLGPATNVNTAQPRTFTKTIFKTLGVATNVNTAQTLVVTKPIFKAISVASTANASQPVTKFKTVTRTVIPASANVATTLSVTKPIRKTLGVATNLSTAQAVTYSKGKTLGTGTALNSARPLSITQLEAHINLGQTYRRQVLNDNPGLYWTLGATGATDQTANGHNGTGGGGITIGGNGSSPLMLTGGSTDFDGSDDYISTNWNPTVNGTLGITFEGWAWRNTSTTDDFLFGRFDEDRLYLKAGSNDVQFTTYGGGQEDDVWTNAWPGNGQWVHWMLRFAENSDTVSLSINGTFISSLPHPGTWFAGNNITLGANLAGVGGNFDGRMAHFAIYNNAIVPANRLAAHYEVASTGTIVPIQLNSSRPLTVTKPIQKTLGVAAMQMTAVPAARTSFKIITTPTQLHTARPRDRDKRVSLQRDYRGAVLAASPSHYLRLGETSGTVAEDQTANNRDGTYAGTFTLNQTGALTGDSDPAVDLDGTTGLITTGYDPFVVGSVRTYEGLAWRDTSTSHDTLFGGTVGTGANNRPWCRLASGLNSFLWQPDENIGSTATWTNAWPGNAQWVHWALVYDDSTFTSELFLNGISQGQRTTTNGYQSINTSNLEWGARRGGTGIDNFDGKMDEVAVYEYGLSAKTIATHATAVTTAFTAATNYPSTVLADSPDRYWRFEESSDEAFAQDEINPAKRGVISGSGITKGQYGLQKGFAATSDGVSDAVVGLDQIASPGPLNYTLECWFKTTTTSGGKIMGFGNSTGTSSGSYDRHVYMTDAGTLIYGIYTGSFATIGPTTKAYNDGSWHHIVATLHSTNGMTFYVDGVSMGTNAATAAQAYSGYWHVFGDNLNSWPSASTSRHFAGQIDEFAVYSTALNQATAQAHYAAGISVDSGLTPSTTSTAQALTKTKTIVKTLGVATNLNTARAALQKRVIGTVTTVGQAQPLSYYRQYNHIAIVTN